MKRELNTPEEMFKRLVYSIYVGCLFFGGIFGLMGLLGGRPDAACAAGVLIPTAMGLRVYGVRKLEFRRLAESFPMGSPEDALTKEQRLQFESLMHAFETSTQWTERQAIRQDMALMVKHQPLLFTVYAKDIMKVHPTLFHKMNNLQQL